METKTSRCVSFYEKSGEHKFWHLSPEGSCTCGGFAIEVNDNLKLYKKDKKFVVDDDNSQTEFNDEKFATRFFYRNGGKPENCLLRNQKM